VTRILDSRPELHEIERRRSRRRPYRSAVFALQTVGAALLTGVGFVLAKLPAQVAALSPGGAPGWLIAVWVGYVATVGIFAWVAR
jgi:hypothetical protein